MEKNELLGQENLPAITPTQDEKTMALLAHILTIVVGFIAPLVIYLLKKDESVFVTEHAKESLNFQITVFIAAIVSGVLMLVIVGVFLLMIVFLLNLIFGNVLKNSWWILSNDWLYLVVNLKRT